MKTKNKMLIICKAREVIYYFGNFVEQEELTSEERDILCDFILSATKLSNKIRDTFNEQSYG